MVTREDVENIALLSKLFVPEEELDGLTKSMQEIIDFADTINNAPADGEEVDDKNGAGNTVGTFDLCPDSVISSQKPSEISVKLSCKKEEFAQYGIVFTQNDKKFTVGDCEYT